MTVLNKHAELRKELSNPATGSKDHLRKLALSLLDELETKDTEIEWMRKRIEELAKAREVSEEQRANWFQMAQKLGEDLDAAEKRIAEQQSAIIAPGIMRCAGCGFVLTKNSINMAAGTITAGDSKSEPCPNGCGPLWPVTWKEQAIQMRDDSEQWFLELQQAKNRIAELEARKFKVEMPESFYPDGDTDAPLAVDELEVIAAIVEAGGKPVAFCKRCDREIDLTHRPDGSHYCHAPAAGIGVKGE